MKIALKFLIVFAFLMANLQVNAQRKPKTGDTKPLPPPTLQQAKGASGQDETSVADDDKVWKVVEQPPSFPGGTEAMMAYINKNIKVPDEVIAAREVGKVFVSFIINKDGSISDVKKVGGNVGNAMKEAAIKVVQDMPTWSPGRQNGKKVRVEWILPIVVDYSTKK